MRSHFELESVRVRIYYMTEGPDETEEQKGEENKKEVRQLTFIAFLSDLVRISTIVIHRCK